MLSSILGVSAVLLQTLGSIPYIRDIFLLKTKPERASFWIFFLLISITFATQMTDKVTWAAFLTGASALIVGFIAVLSLKYGYGTFKKKDAFSILFAIIGVAIWLITNQPIVPVIMVILVDFAGFWLTLVKAWREPYTETAISWAATALAATFIVIGAHEFSFVQLGYIIYSVFANWGITFMLLYRRGVVDAKA